MFPSKILKNSTQDLPPSDEKPCVQSIYAALTMINNLSV